MKKYGALELISPEANTVYYMKDGRCVGYTHAFVEPVEFDRIHRIAARFCEMQDKTRRKINTMKAVLSGLVRR